MRASYKWMRERSSLGERECLISTTKEVWRRASPSGETFSAIKIRGRDILGVEGVSLKLFRDRWMIGDL